MDIPCGASFSSGSVVSCIFQHQLPTTSTVIISLCKQELSNDFKYLELQICIFNLPTYLYRMETVILAT